MEINFYSKYTYGNFYGYRSCSSISLMVSNHIFHAGWSEGRHTTVHFGTLFSHNLICSFSLHIIERRYFLPFLLPQFFSVFLESLALRLWEKFQVKWQGFLYFHICITSGASWSLLCHSYFLFLQFLCLWGARAWHPGGLSHPFRFRNPYSLPTWVSIHLHAIFLSVWCVVGFSVQFVRGAVTKLSDMWAFRNYCLSLLLVLLVHQITGLVNHMCTCK